MVRASHRYRPLGLAVASQAKATDRAWLWAAAVAAFAAIAGVGPAPRRGHAAPPTSPDQADSFDTEQDTLARPLPPAEAAATMQVPEGFRVDVFAAEPEVRNPIAMSWDARGRLWVAENLTYAGGAERVEERLRDRVVIFEDADGDGRADRRQVFADGLRQLTGIEVAPGGVWLICPPQLLFVPDADGDDVPDEPPRVVLDGFEVAAESYHNFANGLRFGPDGWLYGRCGGSCPGLIGPPGTPADRRVRLEGGIWRFSPRLGRFEVMVHGMTNPWGHDWNEFGDGFCINTVTGHLWQIIPGAHYPFNGRLDPNPHVYEPILAHSDHFHFDTGAGWQKSRDGAANDLGGGHAHSGLMIYLGDQWPAEYRGRLFTWNMHGRRANQELLEREGSGYVGRHGRDTFISQDPFFRPIELAYGPDGTVAAIDWSDTGECHERTGVHRASGRIFRITHGSPRRSPAADIARLSPVALAELVTHRNEWFVRQARLQLARHAEARSGDLAEAAAVLRRQMAATDPVTACRSALTLHACGLLSAIDMAALLAHPDEHLRAWGVRLISDAWPIDGVQGPPAVSADEAAAITAAYDGIGSEFARLAETDPSGLVRLAVASTLQRTPLARRADLAARLMAREEDAADHNLPLLVWYGLLPVVQAEPVVAAELAAACRWPTTRRLIARRLAGMIDARPEGLERLVAVVAASKDVALRQDIVAGIAAGLAGWRRAPQPAGWNVLAASLADHEPIAATVRDLSAVFGDGRALDEIRKLVLDESAAADVRKSALESLVRQGGDGVRETCLKLLADRRFNVVAAEGLAREDDAEAAKPLVAAYGRFRSPDRPRIIAILTSRPSFARELLAAVAAGRIPIADIGSYDVRQLRALGDAVVDAEAEKLWGGGRDTPEAKRLRIAALKDSLGPAALAAADLPRGRAHFDRNCGRCHRLFGAGETVGPDLTGGNRTNLDYLLENMVDPSGVVPREYRMSVVTLADGRVLGGLVVSRDDRSLTLVTPTDRQVIPLTDVEQVTLTTQSPMPDGMLDQLSADAVRDLVGYLMQPAQVPAIQVPAIQVPAIQVPAE